MGDKALILWGVPAIAPTRWKRAKLALDHKLRRDVYANCMVRSKEKLLEMVHTIIRERPNVITGYAQAIADLARFVNAESLRAWKDIPVIYGAERLWPHDRDDIAQAFGAATWQSNSVASNSVIARVAAAAAADVIPESLAADAERRDHADAGDHDARRGRGRHDAIVVRRMAARAFVWLGGALFVASLACAPGVPHRFGRAAPWAGWSAVGFDAVLVRSSRAPQPVRARRGEGDWLGVVPRAVLRSIYVWIASLLLMLVSVAWQPIGGELYGVTGLLAIALVAVQLAGFWITRARRRRIDPLELAGIRPAAQTEGLQVDRPVRLGAAPALSGLDADGLRRART